MEAYAGGEKLQRKVKIRADGTWGLNRWNTGAAWGVDGPSILQTEKMVIIW